MFLSRHRKLLKREQAKEKSYLRQLLSELQTSNYSFRTLNLNPEWWLTSVISALRRLKRGELPQCKAILGYRKFLGYLRARVVSPTPCHDEQCSDLLVQFHSPML